MKVVKRDGSLVQFHRNKIFEAISKACKDSHGEEYTLPINDITTAVVIRCLVREEPTINIEEIQDIVEGVLMENGFVKVAREYIRYRYNREILREHNKKYEAIFNILEDSSEELKKENSNKDTALVSTQRDYIASEVNIDIARRFLLPKHIVEAHDNGAIHFHDMGNFAHKQFNCCLIDLKGMLDNGTVINGTHIDSPSSFTTACTITTQIIAGVSSAQYGGNTVNVKHLGKYLYKSYLKYLDMFKEEELSKMMMKKDLRDGVQTIQYQINSLQTSQGQTPFSTLFLELDKNDEYLEYTAMIIEEIIKQRIKGVKNEVGVYTTPVFPKLIYVLDDFNSLQGGEYDYLTKLCAKCSTLRMYPDYVSAKKMREVKEGNVVPYMGCRSSLSPWKDDKGEYKFEGRFNQGVVSVNLVQPAIVCPTVSGYFKKLDEVINVAFEALLLRHRSLIGTKSDSSPLHWQHGAIARFKKGEVIDELLKGGYSSISLGYVGLYEATKLITGESHTEPKGLEFAMSVMKHLEKRVEEIKEKTGLGFSLYGTPAESLVYRFARIDKEKYGSIEGITDKDYYTNSYHVFVGEKIDAFEKLKFESQFQGMSGGGHISYVELGNLTNNHEVVEDIIRFIYDNIVYAELNMKSDVCHVCKHEGEMLLDENKEWYCPKCDNRDETKMNIVRRICGYLSSNGFNKGKTSELSQRYVHIG